MKTFLLKDDSPIISWSLLKDGTFYEGRIPDGYDLAVCPSPGYIVIDIDNKGNKRGSDNIPEHLRAELRSTFTYPTKNNGFHHWFKYTGDKILKNTSSSLGIDLRVGKMVFNDKEWSNGGYVKFHPRNSYGPAFAEERAYRSSEELNEWLEKLFT